MISDAVKFRPHNVPSLDVELADKILAALNAINGTLARGPAPPSDNQLQAISTLCVQACCQIFRLKSAWLTNRKVRVCVLAVK